MSAVVELDVLGGTPLFSKHELDRNKMNSQVRPRSLCVLPKTPMLSTRKLSSSIGVWKPCMPFQVMFLRVEIFDDLMSYASGIGPATAHCIAIRVPSATRMKSCVVYSIRMDRDNDRRPRKLTAKPWTIATLSLFSMTLGRTLSVDATLWSFPGPPVVGLI